MGMYEHKRSIGCPDCGASKTVKVSRSRTKTVGTCKTCGYEKSNKNGYTRNKISESYITIPDKSGGFSRFLMDENKTLHISGKFFQTKCGNSLVEGKLIRPSEVMSIEQLFDESGVGISTKYNLCKDCGTQNEFSEFQ